MNVGKLKLLEELPAFQRWYVDDTTSKTVEESLDFYRSVYASFDQMILYLDLFRPEFVEVEGIILRATQIPENLTGVIKQLTAEGRPLASVEYLYNHLHLHDYCLNDSDYNDIPQETAVAIAHIVAQMWREQLANLFPEKTFFVGVGNEDAEVEVFAYVDRGDLTVDNADSSTGS